MAVPSFTYKVRSYLYGVDNIWDFSVARPMLTLQLLFPFWVTWVCLVICIFWEMCRFYVLSRLLREKKKKTNIRVEMREEHSQQ